MMTPARLNEISQERSWKVLQQSQSIKMQEELKECTFMPKISSVPQFEKFRRQAPKGFVESVARVREAHNRK